MISSQETSCCIWVAIPVDWVILYWRACGADGRAYGQATTKYSRMPRVCCIEMIRIRISDPRSRGSWPIKCTDDSLSRVDSSVHLFFHDPSDLGSLIMIRIVSKERTHRLPNLPMVLQCARFAHARTPLLALLKHYDVWWVSTMYFRAKASVLRYGWF